MTFKINRVYTRAGDLGQTRLADNSGVSKAHPLIAACGDLDELNAVIGLAKENIPPSCAELRGLLEELQQQLFDFGSFISQQSSAPLGERLLKHVSWLEHACDELNSPLPELSSFVLPGGTSLAAWMHLARTVARRAERNVVYALEEPRLESARATNPALAYINRVSDFLFVAARWALYQENKSAPLWNPDR